MGIDGLLAGLNSRPPITAGFRHAITDSLIFWIPGNPHSRWIRIDFPSTIEGNWIKSTHFSGPSVPCYSTPRPTGTTGSFSLRPLRSACGISSPARGVTGGFHISAAWETCALRNVARAAVTERNKPVGWIYVDPPSLVDACKSASCNGDAGAEESR